MNKRAQGADFGAIITTGIVILLAVIFLSIFIEAFHSTSCSDELAQIKTLTGERDYWKGLALSQNETVSNCTNLIKEQRDICDNRISESIKIYESKNQACSESVQIIQIVFIVYTFSLVLFIPLSINLFKIVFEFDLGKEANRVISYYKTFWFWSKVILWLVLLFVFLMGLVSILTFKPF